MYFSLLFFLSSYKIKLFSIQAAEDLSKYAKPLNVKAPIDRHYAICGANWVDHFETMREEVSRLILWYELFDMLILLLIQDLPGCPSDSPRTRAPMPTITDVLKRQWMQASFIKAYYAVMRPKVEEVFNARKTYKNEDWHQKGCARWVLVLVVFEQLLVLVSLYFYSSLVAFFKYDRKLKVNCGNVREAWEQELCDAGLEYRIGSSTVSAYVEEHNPMKMLKEDPIWRGMLYNWVFHLQPSDTCPDCTVASRNLYSVEMLVH